MTRRILILFLFLIPSLARAQGQQITAGPFPNSGLLYVCPVPSGGTPCPSPVSIFSNITLTTGISNPIVVFAQQTYTFYVAGGQQYTLEMPASGVQQVVGGGGGGSSLGASLNVKLPPYNAVGNGKFFVDGVTNAGNNQLTSATATFAASDANQNVWCITNPASGSAALWTTGFTTVASFVNSSTITYSGTNAGVNSGMYCALINPADPPAVLSAFNACKTTFQPPISNQTSQSPSCNIYLPAGFYGVSNTLDNLISTGNESCVGIIGDAQGKSVLLPTPQSNFTYTGHPGWLINERCQAGLLEDFTIEAASNPYSFAGPPTGVISINGGHNFLRNVGVVDFLWNGSGSGTFGIDYEGGTNIVAIHPYVTSNGSGTGTNGGLLLNNVSQANVYSPFLSNTKQNLEVINAQSGANGAAIVVEGGVVDEGSITKAVNSVDTWFNGITLTGGANCINVDGTSFVWLTGGYCGTFGGGTGGGPTVASGGVLNMTQVHVNAVNAGSACYTSAAYGGIVDDGTNRCTTSGGGTVYPSGGIINKTSLSHAQANAFQSGTLAAGTVQSFAVDQPIAVSSITWTPSNAFACTAGSFPTLSVTDGTVTLTTAATDTATNGAVTHTFANTTASILNPSGTVGTVIQMKVVTTGTCGTAPTNTNMNVFWQATAPGV